MSPRALLGLALAALAASGCGLKGPLYLPEKSDVTIRQAPATTAPETPVRPADAPAPADTQAPAPEPESKPDQPPQDPEAGPDRG